MAIEIALGFVLPCSLQRTRGLAKAMLRTAHRGLLFRLLPPDSFTCPAKIDDITHYDVPNDSRYVDPSPACPCALRQIRRYRGTAHIFQPSDYRHTSYAVPECSN